MGWTSEWKQKTDYGELSCSHNQSNFTSIFSNPNNNTLGSAGTYTNITGAREPSFGVDIPQTDGSRTWNLPSPESGVWKDVFSVTLLDKNTFLPATGNYCKWKVQVNVIEKSDLRMNYQLRGVIVDALGNITVTGDTVTVNNTYASGFYDGKVYICNGLVNLGTNRVFLFVGTEEYIITEYRQVYYYGSYVRQCVTLNIAGIENLYGVTYPLTNFVYSKSSPEFGPAADIGGGYNEDSPHKGSFDNSSDRITPSPKPTITPLSSNLVHAYKVTTAMLNDIADAMYPDYVFSNTTIEDALAGIYNAIFFSKYVDFMLDLLILPIDVPAPTTVNVKVGGKFLKTGSEAFIQAQLVQDPYVDFECGSLSIEEYWANFLDFAGTRVKLFLPYVGYVDIQPEYIIGGELTIKYRFNVLDGSFMIFITSSSGHSELEESMVAQFSGVAGVHVPLQAADYSQKVSGLISAIGGVAAGAASGGLSAAVAASGIANASQTLIQKPGSSHANGYNASSSYLSHRTPYLIIERQSSQFSEKYPEEVGLPLNVLKTLGECQGLTRCEAAHLDTIPCSVEGKEKIAQFMSQGIIL